MMGDLREEGYEKIGEYERVRGQPIENYGNKEQKKWFHNIVAVPDLHPCTAGNKEEEHTQTHTRTHARTHARV